MSPKTSIKIEVRRSGRDSSQPMFIPPSTKNVTYPENIDDHDKNQNAYVRRQQISIFFQPIYASQKNWLTHPGYLWLGGSPHYYPGWAKQGKAKQGKAQIF